MTELQILRNALFDEISRLKRKTTKPEESLAIVKTANAIVSTYNTELKALSLIIAAEQTAATVPELNIFKEDDKNELDYRVGEREKVNNSIIEEL